MRITLLLAAAAVFGAVHDMNDRRSLPPGPSSSPRPGVALHGLPLETPATEVCLGDIAPDFAYQGVGARWHRLRDLAGEAPILLVFGANDATLRAIDGEREALKDLGITPVAVVSSRLGGARAIVSRLGLNFTVLADPHGAISTQFNAIDPSNGRQLPAWFVLDPKRRVRALGREKLPARGYAELASEALGVQPRAATLPGAR